MGVDYAPAPRRTVAPRPYGTLIVGGVPKPTPAPKPPTLKAPKPPTISAPPAPPAANPSSDATGGAPPANTQASSASLFDYSADPVLQKIKAAGALSVGEAEAAALQGKRAALAAFGSQELARQILGANDPTIGAISDNPDTSFSTLAQIARANREQKAADTESYNKQNLFYSGHFAKDLSDLEHGREQKVHDATAQLDSTLAQIAATLLAAKQTARDQEAQAEDDAYQRALQEAIANPPPSPTPSAPAAPAAPAQTPTISAETLRRLKRIGL